MFHDTTIQIDDGFEDARVIADDLPEFTAVLEQNDMFANGFIGGLVAYGLKIPEDISFISCDDTWLAKSTSMPLTSIDLCKERMAAKAVELLFQRLKESGWSKSKRANLDMELGLIIRESTGPVNNKRLGQEK